MIYLIKSAGYSDKGYIDLLKIGYTDDTNKMKRLSQYKLHNPTCKVLCLIPEATEKQERWLHKYFKRFRYQSYGHEWFYCKEEILDFFNTHKTRESLGSVGLKGPRYIMKTELSKITDQLVRILFNTGKIDEIEAMSKSESLVEQIFIELNNPSEFDSVYNWIYKNYSIKKEDLKEDICLSNFYKITRTTDRIKYIYDNHDDIDFEKVPAEYKIYYNTLGLDRIKALGYQKSKLDKELENKYYSSNDSLRDEIYNTFLINEKYLTLDIKKSLENIYKKYSISKVAKAIDLFDYFNMKSIQKTNKSSGKREHGYLIISKK